MINDMTEGIERIMSAKQQVLEMKMKIALMTAALTEIRDSKFCSYESHRTSNQYTIGVTDGHRFCANIARKALE